MNNKYFTFNNLNKYDDVIHLFTKKIFDFNSNTISIDIINNNYKKIENDFNYKFKCIKQTESLETNTPHSVSKYSPIKEFRCCDSIYRIKKWIDKSIMNMDKLYNYLRN